MHGSFLRGRSERGHFNISVAGTPILVSKRVASFRDVMCLARRRLLILRGFKPAGISL
jgi:hypothetical protein